MTDKYIDDLKLYCQSIDETALRAIVKHLGIALRSADASMVSCTSKEELTRVRESWLKKKLAVTGDDATLDTAISEVCARMKGAAKKSRVTVYYLLAEKLGKLPSLR